MRTAAHPGPVLEHRDCWVSVDACAPETLMLAEGDDLFTEIHAALDARGATGGAFVLADGCIARLTLMTGGKGEGVTPMTFRGPHVMAAPLTVVAGAGNTGIGASGERISHCHAAFHDATGRLVGGHLVSGQTIAGPQGMRVQLTGYLGGRLRHRVDPETQFTIFHPERV